MESNLHNALAEIVASAVANNYPKIKIVKNLPLLFPTDEPLFLWYNQVPTDDFFYTPTEYMFSYCFNQILESQNESALLNMAKLNYDNDSYWLNSSTLRVPMFQPDQNQVASAIANASSFDYSFDAKISNDSLNFSNSFLVFLEKLASNIAFDKVNFNLHFDALASVPFSPKGWFTPSVFAIAYKNKSSWNSSSSTTWDTLFGSDGELQFLNTELVVGSGLTVKIVLYGNYSVNEFEAIKEFLNEIWPFNMQRKCLQESFQLMTDGSIEINLSSVSNSILIVGMQVASVESLLS